MQNRKKINLEPYFFNSKPLRICSRCVLDTNGPHEISFDSRGICNYCHDYELVKSKIIELSIDERKAKIKRLVNKITSEGRDKKYNCILGLSGGMDSSYIALLAKKFELRPLVVHLDNGWDAELAVKNIENIIKTTNFDYYNHVIDWDEFKDIQLAYLKASVIDTEVVTDQAIFALLHQVAYKYGIKNILFGDNPKTERIMPKGWSYKKNDLANLVAIHNKFGKVKIKSYPMMGSYDLVFYKSIAGIDYVSLLHYHNVDLKTMKVELAQEFDWKDYRWKHCESVFTRFYQGYILPKKFNADKRKAHLSDLILSGEMSREEALLKLKEPYYNQGDLEKDYDFVLRKFGLNELEFEEILKQQPVNHTFYPTDKFSLSQRIKLKLMKIFKSFGIYRN